MDEWVSRKESSVGKKAVTRQDEKKNGTLMDSREDASRIGSKEGSCGGKGKGCSMGAVKKKQSHTKKASEAASGVHQPLPFSARGSSTGRKGDDA